MKKILFTLFGFLAIYPMIFAGGIVTNTNQSAAWVRTLARDASVDVDAVFYNPAGLTHLENGFYIQVNSQTVAQTRTVTSTYPTLNDGTYEGKTFVPFLPTVFAAYKFGNFAISGGFTVIGGGGGSEFDKGLPDFEYPMVVMPSTLTENFKELSMNSGVDLSASGYSANIYFNGTSAYFGYQGAISYAINDMVSVSLGARYITAKNTYDGYIKDVSTGTATGFKRVDEFLNTDAVGAVNKIIGQLNGVIGIPNLLNPYLGTYGGATLAQAKPLLDQIDPTYYPSLVAAGQLIGLTDPNTVTLQQLNDGILGATPVLNAKIAGLNKNADDIKALALAQFADKEVNVEQTGSGFSPFFGIDLNLLDGNLGLAVKYEMKTNMKVKTKVIKQDNPIDLFTDGEEVPANIPAMLSLGLRYKLAGLKLQTGFHYYFDDAAQYGKKNAAGDFVTNGEETTFTGSTDTKLLASNTWEFAIGAQYDITSMFGLSAGFLKTKSDPNPVYQSSLSYTQPTTTFGFGAVVHLTSKFDIDLGMSLTSYDDYEKDFGTYKETYDKNAKIFALGLSYKL